MLNQLFNLTRPLFVLDTETTGLDVLNNRIVEISFQEWTAEGLKQEWRTFINPGVPIPPAVTAVHGITNYKLAMCRECGFDNASHVGNASERGHEFKSWPTFKQLATNLATGFRDCDYAGKNVRFDLRIMAAEMNRASVQWDYAGAYIIDADRLEQIGEPRHLSDLYKKHTGKTLEDAHEALADVRASTEVIAAQLEKYAVLSRDLATLHEAQWPGWVTNDGSFRMIDGVVICTFGKHRNKSVRSIPSDYWDWLLKQQFPEDVRQLARDAKVGKYV